MKKFQYVMLLGSFLTLSNSGIAMQGSPPPLLFDKDGKPYIGQASQQQNNPQIQGGPPSIGQLLQQQPNQNTGGLQPPPFNQIMNQNIQGGGGIAATLDLGMLPAAIDLYNQGTNEIDAAPIQKVLELFRTDPEIKNKLIALGNTQKQKDKIKNNIEIFLQKPEVKQAINGQGNLQKVNQQVHQISQSQQTFSQSSQIPVLQPRAVHRSIIDTINEMKIKLNTPEYQNEKKGFLPIKHFIDHIPLYIQKLGIPSLERLKGVIIEIIRGRLFGIIPTKVATKEDENTIKILGNQIIGRGQDARKLRDLLTDNDFETLKEGTYFVKQGNNLTEIPVDQRFINHIDTLKTLIKAS